MKTPDDIKNGLECCNVDDCMDCPYNDCLCIDDMVTDAIALIEQLEAQVPQWISVEDDEKPKRGQDCLCICSYNGTKKHEWDYMMVLRWMGNGDNGYVNRPHFQHEGMNEMTVTHWMPLPEPPKEDENE